MLPDDDFRNLCAYLLAAVAEKYGVVIHSALSAPKCWGAQDRGKTMVDRYYDLIYSRNPFKVLISLGPVLQ
jgi:hypothetical protein